jgi:hypothetical protein
LISEDHKDGETGLKKNLDIAVEMVHPGSWNNWKTSAGKT